MNSRLKVTKVYINNKDGGRKLIDVELVEERKSTIVVKLPDGNVIVRKKTRDVPQGEEK